MSLWNFILWTNFPYISEIFSALDFYSVLGRNIFCFLFINLVTLKRPIKSPTFLLFFCFVVLQKRPIKSLCSIRTSFSDVNR